MRGGNNSSSRSGNYRNPCITMHQPWASLLVYGIKRIEGRSWPSPITGRLWIHAAGKVPEESTIKAMEYFYKEIYALNGITDIQFPQHYPVSRLLGCVEVVGCLKRDELACWEMVPEGVRLEALTDYCWLCERPQKLLVPFEMRGYQGVYNLERKIYEAAVRGLSPVDSPLPVKFPLPDPRDPFSLKPGSLSAISQNSKATEVDKSSSISLAIAGAREAATQFSKKDHNSQSTGRNNTPDKMDANQEETNVARSYNLRWRRKSLESDNVSSAESNKKIDDGASPSEHEQKSSSKMSEGSSSHNQSPSADRSQPIQSPTEGALECKEKRSCDMDEGSSKHHQSPVAEEDSRQPPQPPSKKQPTAESSDVKLSLVGRFLTQTPIRTRIMKERMATVWHPVKGVAIKELKRGLFLFQFFHKIDLQRVLNGGPWNFDNHILLLSPIGENEIPAQVPLQHVVFWVQIHDIPMCFMTMEVGKRLGQLLGEFLEYDSKNNNGIWRSYMRIRVKMDVQLPLKRVTKIRHAGNGRVYIVRFKYERLNVFCFLCGMLGHTDQICEKLYLMEEDDGVKGWGSELRVDRRPSVGPSKWLREG